MTSNRSGRPGIEAILNDMTDKSLLPTERSDRPDKKACLRTYGMLRNFFNKAITSPDPITQYREMLAIENTLRQRLSALNPTKEIPREVVNHLNELRAALNEVISLGPDGVTEMHEMEVASRMDMVEPGVEEPVTERPAPIKMVPITMVQKVREELKEEKEKNGRLNFEINALALELRRVTSERDQLLRSHQRY